MRLINLVSAAAVLLASGGIAHAVEYTVFNKTDKAVWMSKYDLVGAHIKTLCLLPGASQTAISGQGVIVYIRGELKERKTDCGGKTLSDTGKGQPIMLGKNTMKFFNAHENKLYLQ